MPAHLTGDLNALTIDKPDPLINSFPVALVSTSSQVVTVKGSTLLGMMTIMVLYLLSPVSSSSYLQMRQRQ
jgi:hypothetical protein